MICHRNPSPKHQHYQEVARNFSYLTDRQSLNQSSIFFSSSCFEFYYQA